jgi:hypothetical protein
LTGQALVAADGAASLIRGDSESSSLARKELSHIVNCYFRADIEPHLGDRKGVLFFNLERARQRRAAAAGRRGSLVVSDQRAATGLVARDLHPRSRAPGSAPRRGRGTRTEVLSLSCGN